MSIEEKRKTVMNHCDETDCDACVLRTNDWEHYAMMGCLSIEYATEEELDRAISILLGESKKAVPVIKDSGTRRTFSSGAVRDAGDLNNPKGRMDLLPWAAIMEVSKHSQNGAAKYGEHNVDRGIPTSSLCDSGARHLAKYLDGWDDEPHLLAAAWNLLWAIQMEIKHPEMVDTPWKQEGKEND
jgi:hypothetical protein